MLTTSLITVLSSLLLVNAQANPQLETASIKAQFSASYLVPDLLAAFNPVGFLTVNYGGNPVSPGSLLAVAGECLRRLLQRPSKLLGSPRPC